MTRKAPLAISFLVAAMMVAGCGQEKQEELAEKQLQDRKEDEKRKADGEKALTSKKGFNPF